MKKSQPVRIVKLALHKETLHALEESQLEHIAGAITAASECGRTTTSIPCCYTL